MAVGTTIALIKALSSGGGGGSGGAVDDVQVNGVSVVSGGVADIPAASNSTLGAVKGRESWGIGVQAGETYVAEAASAQIKAGTASYRPIVPGHQHESAFYGLAKAAGDSTQSASSNAVGTYTDAAKSAISTMLNGSVAVSGTTPSITALSGVRYVCGEVSELTITVPASGIIDVVFTSGSTPTVLTISGATVTWANDFDPDEIEADTTYELNIMDGFGVVGQWT